MRPSQSRSSVLDCFGPCHGDSVRQCMERAVLCNHLAKFTSGRIRRKLYRFKNQNIRAALARPGAEVDVRIDRDRCVGLLSVRLKSAPDVRMHTHENWIDAA